MMTMWKRWVAVAAVALGLVSLLWPADGQSGSQDVPDAPSATKSQTNPFPADAPKGPPAAKPEPAPVQSTDQPGNTRIPANVKNVPQGGATPDQAPDTGVMSSREDVIRVSVNQVYVPVTIRDNDGRLVEGLTVRDFAVYEDGIRQPINFFTSDPFPLSVAVVVDLGMPDVTMKRVNESLPNIVGAFSQFDEVSLYTFGNSVSKVLDFSAVNDKLSAAIKRSRRPGRSGGGVPMGGGPMNAGPSVNGHPIDPGTPHQQQARNESRVLNDAILMAAQDLAKRRRDYRKIVFVISDGREDGSRASYQDVMKVLLSNDVSVYAVAVGDAAIPGYDTLGRVHVPGTGYQNLLPKYSSATGGQIYTEFTREAIEDSYARITETARNQYTLGYKTKSAVAANYRSIEIRVHKGGLRVFARDGYYPLPPPRQQAQ
ncbi:MAG: VWA domain-containing protein [Acidobacteriota bacterium]|nr:VWA domain-containing protein [Acidobacteriota bacterium]